MSGETSGSSEDLIDRYDFELPPELIAQHPLGQRDQSRLLVLDRHTGERRHHRFCDLPTLLRPGDMLVLNDTRVLPARLVGRRANTGGRWEGLFLDETEPGRWRLVGQTRGKLQPGEAIHVVPPDGTDGADVLELRLVERGLGGVWSVDLASDRPAIDVLQTYGHVPLPPYIRDGEDLPEDRTDYQTVYAARPGSVAAPTAGLHFTPELLDRCGTAGIRTTQVTLHVGLGTFRPVTAPRLKDHVMHSEWYEVPPSVAAAVAETKSQGGRVVAVGTTVVRTLESAAIATGAGRRQGTTNLFIRPPYRFRAVDAMVTNFHLPKSTLLVLLSAFAGREPVLNAYREAVAERYRFFSYGDAMLIL